MDFQLVVLRGRSAKQSVRLLDGVTTVGRQDDCQLRIASAQVSRKHCQLFEHKGHLLVKDLGSSNGTFVNGKKVAQQRVLESGDELSIGPVKFRVEKRPQSSINAISPQPPRTAGDTNVAPAGAPVAANANNAQADDAPILGAPVVPEEGDFDVVMDEAPISLSDDDIFEIDFDEEPAPPHSPSDAPAEPTSHGVPMATPLPPPLAREPHAQESAGEPEPPNDDAVADFLSNLKIDED